ncbi:MAG: HlyD family efflux transporter periplasmic adaptor subunit [Agathobacter sp.]|nr:HlyD family efflux transporter periplasmic adaptor subunit [Agathobacter sp.]
MTNNKNIIKYKRGQQFNIGYAIFFIILFFILFKLFTYFTSSKVAEYEVTQGTIATNKVNRGMIIRDEKVVYSDKEGYVNYYIKSGTKVSVRDTIYSVDTNGDISKKISSVTDDGTKLNDVSLQNILDDIDGFTNSYSNVSFSKTYSFKQELQSELNQTLSTTALKSLSDQVDSAKDNQTFTQYTASESGIVSYYVDGYENTNADNFDADDFNITSYSTKDLTLSNNVKISDPVYKIVNDENWNILLPVSNSILEQLKEDEGYVKIRICKDEYKVTVKYNVIKKDNNNYLMLFLNKAMIRYISDRFLDVELIINEDSGLKIPNSSIVEKEFFAIPKDFVTMGKDSNEYTLMVKNDTESSKDKIKLVTPTVYHENNKYIYIDEYDISKGDVLAQSDSKKTFKVGSYTKKLKGVYCVNKGYAVFKQIDVLTQNDDYTIVDTKTDYGLALYDHIALDGNKIQKNQSIVK